MAKKTKTKRVRVTLADKLVMAENRGYELGKTAGRAEAGREFLPNWQYKEALTDFARAIEGWPIEGSAVVALTGTDLKHICNLAIPARTAKAIAAELKRLGYHT